MVKCVGKQEYLVRISIVLHVCVIPTKSDKYYSIYTKVKLKTQEQRHLTAAWIHAFIHVVTLTSHLFAIHVRSLFYYYYYYYYYFKIYWFPQQRN